jgi:hypothetical protein
MKPGQGKKRKLYNVGQQIAMSSEDIARRFFHVLDLLIANGTIPGIRLFCEVHKIERRNFSRLRKQPKRKFDLRFMFILVKHYNINANYLICGVGKVYQS